jgi:phospholipase/carboxylesterase
MQLSRREFGILVGTTVTAFSSEGTLIGQQRAGDPRLTVKFKATTTTSARSGTHPLRLGDGRGRDGLLHVPDTLSPGPVPLMVLLHGAGSTGRRQLDRMIGAINDAGVVVLAPDSRGGTWDAIRGDFRDDVAFIGRALEKTVDAVAVDPERLTIAGFSDGATYALSLGLLNGALFTRIAAFSPGFVVDGLPAGKPKIFMSHGTRDPILPIDQCSRAIAPVLRARGYDLTFREFNGGHEIPAAVQAEGLAWVAAK